MRAAKKKKGRVGEYQVRASGIRWLPARCTRKLQRCSTWDTVLTASG